MGNVINIHPGEILREEFLLPLGLSQNRLAIELRVPVHRINEIVREKRGITTDTALRLSQFFGTTPDFWINLQKRYEMTEIRNRSRNELSKITPYAVCTA